MIDRASAIATVCDQTATTQYGKVLRDGGLRDGKALCKRRYGGFAAGELLEDGEARGIGEGLEESGLAFVWHD